jgi:hypothetical protein
LRCHRNFGIPANTCSKTTMLLRLGRAQKMIRKIRRSKGRSNCALQPRRNDLLANDCIKSESSMTSQSREPKSTLIGARTKFIAN